MKNTYPSAVHIHKYDCILDITKLCDTFQFLLSYAYQMYQMTTHILAFRMDSMSTYL